MSRGTEQQVVDILDAVARCRRPVAARAERPDDESSARRAEDAMERNLQVIGEAAGHLPMLERP